MPVVSRTGLGGLRSIKPRHCQRMMSLVLGPGEKLGLHRAETRSGKSTLPAYVLAGIQKRRAGGRTGDGAPLAKDAPALLSRNRLRWFEQHADTAGRITVRQWPLKLGRTTVAVGPARVEPSG